jgi:hypothetical protein
MNLAALVSVVEAFDQGNAIPYLGPGVLRMNGLANQLPCSPSALAGRMTAKCSVPHKIKNNLTAAAQFIENFKHRRTVRSTMTEAFGSDSQPTLLHTLLANQPLLPLLVHAWYDDLPQKALRSRADWGMVQGVSQSEHYGNWVHYFDANGLQTENQSAGNAHAWKTLLYQPLGSVWPAHNYLVSDSDFVEVLTEIDIQTPIPEAVQEIRKGRSFLFLGCRFANQLDRLFARQIMKRSSDQHWAVLPEETTLNETRFLARHNIERIPMALEEFVAALAQEQMVH